MRLSFIFDIFHPYFEFLFYIENYSVFIIFQRIYLTIREFSYHFFIFLRMLKASNLFCETSILLYYLDPTFLSYYLYFSYFLLNSPYFVLSSFHHHPFFLFYYMEHPIFSSWIFNIIFFYIIYFLYLKGRLKVTFSIHPWTLGAYFLLFLLFLFVFIFGYQLAWVEFVYLFWWINIRFYFYKYWIIIGVDICTRIYFYRIDKFSILIY